MLLRREAGPIRVTIFEGGHAMEISAAYPLDDPVQSHLLFRKIFLQRLAKVI